MVVTTGEVQMPKVEVKRRRRSVAQWQALVERGESSGLSVAAFCRAEAISPASYFRWRERLAQSAATPDTPGAAPGFIDLGTLGARRVWDLEIDLGAGIVLRLRRA
jgi:transposase-like protein